MIILDTNVISEPLGPSPDATVLKWLDQQEIETLYLTSITVAELRFGIAALPAGKRRRRLEQDFDERILSLFSGRVLAFDKDSTPEYARIRSKAKASGRPVGVTDAFIAAIAAHHGFSVATRDVSPFEAADIRVINPWKQ